MSETYSALGLLQPVEFAQRVRDELAALALLPQSADEGIDVSVVPGGFGPTCAKHETLRNNPATFATFLLAEDEWLSMFDVFGRWILGQTPSIAITPPDTADVCSGGPSIPMLDARRAGWLVTLVFGLVLWRVRARLAH